jgi:hypothetical protein
MILPGHGQYCALGDAAISIALRLRFRFLADVIAPNFSDIY